MPNNPEEVPTHKKSNAMDAESGSEPVMTNGSHSPQDNSSTTVDSGKIRAVSLSSKKTEPPKREGYYQAMLRDLREQDELMRQNAKKMRTSSSDLVNKPSHYNQAGIECIEAIRAALGPEGFSYYCQGNSMKYLWRFRYKNGVQDLQKCRVYLDWLMEEMEK